jgi:glucosamine--fructose-6-phosphate aminotransferase (isomerizing)
MENIQSDKTTIILKVPSCDHLSWLLALFPIQILAYKLSVFKGINPDKPKNLAKVVSVE